MRGDYIRRDQAIRGPHKNYAGRGSTDNNRPQMSEKRTAAVVASSLTTTGQVFKKDTDLRKVCRYLYNPYFFYYNKIIFL